MPTILTCTDGSIYASSVYKHTAWAATKARKNLLSKIVELEAIRAKVARKHGEAILEDAVAELRSAGIQEILADQKHGRLSDSIESYEHDADLVTVGGVPGVLQTVGGEAYLVLLIEFEIAPDLGQR